MRDPDHAASAYQRKYRYFGTPSNGREMYYGPRDAFRYEWSGVVRRMSVGELPTCQRAPRDKVIKSISAYFDTSTDAGGSPAHLAFQPFFYRVVDHQTLYTALTIQELGQGRTCKKKQHSTSTIQTRAADAG